MRASPSSPSSIVGKWPSARWLVLASGGFFLSQLKTSFFPDDVQYWSYVDVWLPNDANFDATNQAASRWKQIIREQADEWGKEHPEKDGSPSQILRYVTTGSAAAARASGSRSSPQPQAAQLRAGPGAGDRQGDHARFRRTRCNRSLSARLPGARSTIASCRRIPSTIRWRFASSARPTSAPRRAPRTSLTLRRIAAQVEDIVRDVAGGRRAYATSGRARASQVTLNVDPDRANLAGITNLDVANSATSAMSGTTVTTLQDGDKNIPVVARLQMDERAQPLRHSEPLRLSPRHRTRQKVPLVAGLRRRITA